MKVTVDKQVFVDGKAKFVCHTCRITVESKREYEMGYLFGAFPAHHRGHDKELAQPGAEFPGYQAQLLYDIMADEEIGA